MSRCLMAKKQQPGWHFTALDDFEHVFEQKKLDPAWQGIRVWHKVNYVPSVTEQGEPALVPKEQFGWQDLTFFYGVEIEGWYKIYIYIIYMYIIYIYITRYYIRGIYRYFVHTIIHHIIEFNNLKSIHLMCIYLYIYINLLYIFVYTYWNILYIVCLSPLRPSFNPSSVKHGRKRSIQRTNNKGPLLLARSSSSQLYSSQVWIVVVNHGHSRLVFSDCCPWDLGPEEVSSQQSSYLFHHALWCLNFCLKMSSFK